MYISSCLSERIQRLQIRKRWYMSTAGEATSSSRTHEAKARGRVAPKLAEHAAAPGSSSSALPLSVHPARRLRQYSGPVWRQQGLRREGGEGGGGRRREEMRGRAPESVSKLIRGRLSALAEKMNGQFIGHIREISVQYDIVPPWSTKYYYA
ncbi:hypothetical protein PENSPDRAFT_664626 [Peniophora sp. CONT]|nr:hypothetical protein PENSPDRAFT_664626 [Peniophora sp. CONT]